MDFNSIFDPFIIGGIATIIVALATNSMSYIWWALAGVALSVGYGFTVSPRLIVALATALGVLIAIGLPFLALAYGTRQKPGKAETVKATA